MTTKTYAIFGAGASGLYTAWRLLTGKQADGTPAKRCLAKGDRLALYDWGRYDFGDRHEGSRSPGARICTWYYDNNPDNSYLELGGMRYSHWDQKPSETFPDPNGGAAPGHRLVTKVIELLDLDRYAVPFNVTNNQLFYLRAQNFYLNDISSRLPAPYAANNYGATTTPDQGFNTLEALSFNAKTAPQTRQEWCNFYQTGTITVDLPDSSVFQKGDLLRDIGYWNLLVDQLGQEGYEYAADGNGYSSNVINTNSAFSFNMNNEFAPGTQYRTLSIGFSGMFLFLFEAIERQAAALGVTFDYQPDTRLHSILWREGKAEFTLASRADPTLASGAGKADAAWLAMGRGAIDLVAQATRFQPPPAGALDVLNHEAVSLYLEATIMQPSYKVGMFFDTPWWAPDCSSPAPYPAAITGFVVTEAVIAELKREGFPGQFLPALERQVYVAYDSAEALVKAVESDANAALSVAEIKQLTAAARRDTIGPSATNLPIRMVVYFGNNARKQTDTPVYGILASYDDEDNTEFWRELELGPNRNREIPASRDTQPLDGPRVVPERMEKMLRKMLAQLHFGPNATYASVPKPLQSAYMDWALPPFNAGYHEWAPHYDIGDVQRKIRKPSQLIEGADAEIYIVGEAYSNDQAWVEGAYATSESVLNDFFGIAPLIDDTHYPFIWRPAPPSTSSETA